VKQAGAIECIAIAVVLIAILTGVGRDFIGLRADTWEELLGTAIIMVGATALARIWK
jgi:hypothetical protein